MENKALAVNDCNASSESSKTAVVIDINLIFDPQTLLFCILRKHLASGAGLDLTNADYELIVNKSFSDSMKSVKEKYLQIYEANQNFEKDVRNEYQRLLPTIKPVIPGLQLIEFLKSQRVEMSINYDERTDQFVLDGLKKQYASVFEGADNCIPKKGFEVQALYIISSSLELIEQVKLSAKQYNMDINKVYPLFIVPKKLDQVYSEDTIKCAIGESISVGSKQIPTRHADLTALPIKDMFPTFTGFRETKKYVDYADTKDIDNLPEYKMWFGNVNVSQVKGGKENKKESLEITGQVVDGYKRGSKQLGVPTANIEMTEENKEKTKDLVPGVYAARGCFPETKDETKLGKFYTAALSIGWNPMFDNGQKTVEVFLLNTFPEDFYNEVLQVDLKKFIRGEALFGNFDTLILAIQSDIEVSRILLQEEQE